MASGLAGCLAIAACGSARPAHEALQSSREPNRQALPGQGRPLVTVGDKNFTEQFILGELYAQALRGQGYTVVLNRDIGPAEVIQRALLSRRLTMYPEYLGVWNSQIAGARPPTPDLGAALRDARRYAQAHALSMLRPTPFSDTPAVAVTSRFARVHHLRTLRDLQRVARTLTLGAPLQFAQSPSGLPALERSYGFRPAGVRALEVGSQYPALDSGAVQAAEVNTTDGQLRGRRYRLLRDPARVLGFGQALPVAPWAALRAEGPAFVRTVDRVSALLSTNAIRALNAAVDIGGQDPGVVARAFLLRHRIAAVAGG